MLPLQLLIRRFHPGFGLLQDVVELIHEFAFIEPEVWQCPIVASLVPCCCKVDECILNFAMNRLRCMKVLQWHAREA